MSRGDEIWKGVCSFCSIYCMPASEMTLLIQVHVWNCWLSSQEPLDRHHLWRGKKKKKKQVKIQGHGKYYFYSFNKDNDILIANFNKKYKQTKREPSPSPSQKLLRKLQIKKQHERRPVNLTKDLRTMTLLSTTSKGIKIIFFCP